MFARVVSVTLILCVICEPAFSLRPQTERSGLEEALRGVGRQAPVAAGIEEQRAVIHPADPHHGPLHDRLFASGGSVVEGMGFLVDEMSRLPEGTPVFLGILPQTSQQVKDLSAMGLEPLIPQDEVWRHVKQHAQWPPAEGTQTQILLRLGVPLKVPGFPDIQQVSLVPKGGTFLSEEFSERFRDMVDWLRGEKWGKPTQRNPGFVLLEKALFFSIDLRGVPYGLPSGEAKARFQRALTDLTGQEVSRVKWVALSEFLHRRRRLAAARSEGMRRRLIARWAPKTETMKKNLLELLDRKVGGLLQPDREKEEDLRSQIRGLDAASIARTLPGGGEFSSMREAAAKLSEALGKKRANLEREIDSLQETANPLAQHIHRVGRALERRQWSRFGDLAGEDLGTATEWVIRRGPEKAAEEMQQLDRLVLRVSDLLRDRLPGGKAEEEPVRRWQAFAVGFLAACGPLSRESASAFLQDGSSFQFDCWAKWAVTWGRGAGIELDPQRKFWEEAFLTLMQDVRPDQVAEQDREWFEHLRARNVKHLAEYLRKQPGSGSLTSEQIAQLVEEERLRWTPEMPVELKMDLLMRRPAAIWNLSAGHFATASVVADRLGFPKAEEALRREARERLGKSRSLDARYPLWLPRSGPGPEEERRLVHYLSQANQAIRDRDWEEWARFSAEQPRLLLQAAYLGGGGLFDLGKKCVQTMEETVDTVHGVLREPLPDEVRVSLRLLQTLVVLYLVGSGHLTEASARFFASDSSAQHGPVWFVRTQHWRQRLGTPARPLDLAIGSVVEGEALPPNGYFSAYMLLLLVSRPDRFDDGPVRDIWRNEEVRELSQRMVSWFGSQQHPGGPLAVDLETVAQRYRELLAQVPEPPPELLEGVLLGRVREVGNAALVFNELSARLVRELGFNEDASEWEGAVRDAVGRWSGIHGREKLWWPWPDVAAVATAGMEEEWRSALEMREQFEQRMRSEAGLEPAV